MGANITWREYKLKVAFNDGQIYFHSLDQNLKFSINCNVSFSVTQAYGLIHQCSLGQNFILAWIRIWQKSKNTIVGLAAFRAYDHKECTN